MSWYINALHSYVIIRDEIIVFGFSKPSHSFLHVMHVILCVYLKHSNSYQGGTAFSCLLLPKKKFYCSYKCKKSIEREKKSRYKDQNHIAHI